jgi:hypothetical protein
LSCGGAEKPHEQIKVPENRADQSDDFSKINVIGKLYSISEEIGEAACSFRKIRFMRDRYRFGKTNNAP